MTVTTIAASAANSGRLLNSSASTSALINRVLAATPPAQAAQSAGLTRAIALQNQIAQFRVAAQEVAKTGSLLASAEAGANAINRTLARLRESAKLASSPELSSEERAARNQEFQAIRQQIDARVATTRFGGRAVLEGGALPLASGTNAVLGSLTEATLFKGKPLDISTASGAKIAQATIEAAQDYSARQLAILEGLARDNDLIATGLHTAIQNRDAANSTLAKADFTSQLFAAGGANTQASISPESLAAQTNRLPANILTLLAE